MTPGGRPGEESQADRLSLARRARATELLAARASGRDRAADELLPLVYDELRALAARYLRRERAGSTLQPTALVHEAYLRLIENDRIDWQGKTHFLAMAATQMRRILVDHARARDAQKRGGRGRRITLTESLSRTPDASVELLALDEALSRLGARSPRQGRVAELTLFAGLLSREIALAVGVSERTVKEDWRVARSWLMKELAGAAEP
jgi:RNA polymerase sigma factor (TIGR02999 family)